MTEQIIERAINAAARVRSDQWSEETIRIRPGWTWDELVPEDQAKCIDWVTPIVTAALAEVEASLTAELEAVYEALKPVNEYVTGKGYTTVAGGALMVRHEVGLVMRDLAWVAEERDDLAARIARVEALHVRAEASTGVLVCSHCNDPDLSSIGLNDAPWPCETIDALRGESK